MGELGGGVIEWNAAGKVLSAHQRRFYEENGYLIVRNNVPLADIDKYNQRFEYICNADRSEFPSMTVMRDVTFAKEGETKDVDKVNKIQHWQDDPVLFDYCKSPEVLNVVKDLIGTPGCNLVSMHTMIINKPPDTGSLSSRHPLHQDMEYFPFRPSDFICCTWTAMQTVNRANGCLVVIPGSHKGPLHPHVYPDWGANNKAYLGIHDFDPSMPRTYAEMEAGDTIFFNPNIIHGSGSNKTNGYRRAISCHIANDDHCRYSYEKTPSQEQTAKDVHEMMLIRFRKAGLDFKPEDLDYTTPWRMHARPINGIKANL